MKYLLMITDTEGAWDRLPPAQQEDVMRRHGEFGKELSAQNKYCSSLRLRPPKEAKTVRLAENGARFVTDGPFAESKEVMGGYYVVEAASIDEAVQWAKKIPLVYGSVEVRPAWEG